MKRLIVLAAFVLLAAIASARMVERVVDYDCDGVPMRGFAAYDDAMPGWRKVVLVYHDWDGVNDYEKMRCRQIAQLGYVAFAPDIFGRDAKVDTIDERMAMVDKFYKDPKLFRRRAYRGWEYSQGPLLKTVAHNECVAIGYCFGGASALELIRDGSDIKGVVTFHGSLATEKPLPKNRFHGKILVFTGGADPFVPQEQVTAFEEEMKNAGITPRVVTYPGVGHAFTIPGSENAGLKGVAYNKDADQKSWRDFLLYLKTTLPVNRR